MVRKRKTDLRIVGVSFAAVFALLVGGVLAATFLGGPVEEHFPSIINLTIEPWMELMPSSATAFSMINMSAAYADVTGSMSVVTFLRIFQTSQSMTSDNITFLATYYLEAPTANQNATEIFFFKTNPGTYNSLWGALNSSQIVGNETYRSSGIYSIFNNDTTAGSLQNGRICFVDGLILYTQGSSASSDLKTALDYYLDRTPTIFLNDVIRRAFYASTGGKAGYLAFSYIASGTQVEGVQSGAKAVYFDGSKFEADYAYKFQDLDMSRASFKNVTKSYSGGFSYYLMDEYVVAKFTFDPLGLLNQLQTF